MRITANDVRVGDFIPGMGTVDRIRRFQESRSVIGRVSRDRDDSYARVIAGELDSCYSSSVGTVTIVATLGSRSYLAGDSVEVMRLPRARVMSKAV